MMADLVALADDVCADFGIGADQDAGNEKGGLDLVSGEQRE